MRIASVGLALGAPLVFAALVLAQSQDASRPAQDTPPEEQPAEFPEPLQHATSNMSDLERTGFLSVVSVEDRTIDSRGNIGFVWTIRPKKAVTYRHVQMILRELRDVRFYVRQRTTLQEVHTTALHYSNRIDSGAVNGMVFSQDDEFEVWFYLNDAVRQRIAKQNVDLVVFRRLKR